MKNKKEKINLKKLNKLTPIERKGFLKMVRGSVDSLNKQSLKIVKNNIEFTKDDVCNMLGIKEGDEFYQIKSKLGAFRFKQADKRDFSDDQMDEIAEIVLEILNDDTVDNRDYSEKIEDIRKEFLQKDLMDKIEEGFAPNRQK